MDDERYNLLVITGPTATGKTKLAVRLASVFNGEIISADSRQVYKWMDIGTGKDINEYTDGPANIPYHLIDVITPDKEYNLFSFLNDFNTAYEQITNRGRLPILAGGTGLYINAVLQKYELKQSSKKELNSLGLMTDEELLSLYNSQNPSPHNITDVTDRSRLINALSIILSDETGTLKQKHVIPFVIAVQLERSEIKKRITERLKQRLKTGMIEEAEDLIRRGISYEKLNFFGLEYRYLALYLKGELNYNDMFQKLNSAIHLFAKKQMTWFRKMEREGIKLHWIEAGDYQTAEKLIKENFHL